MMWKVSKYDLLELVITINDANILESNATDMLNNSGKLNQSVGKMMRSLGCETISEIKTEFKKIKSV